MPRLASHSRLLRPCGTSAVVSSSDVKTRSSPWAGERPLTWPVSSLLRGCEVSPSSTYRPRFLPWWMPRSAEKPASTHRSARTSLVRSIRQPPWLPIWISSRACPHPIWRPVPPRSLSAASSPTRRFCASSRIRNRASFCDRTARSLLRSPPARSQLRPASCPQTSPGRPARNPQLRTHPRARHRARERLHLAPRRCGGGRLLLRGAPGPSPRAAQR